MGEFNTVGLEDVIEAFSRREQATVEAVPKMLKAGADVLVEAQKAEAQAMGLNETGGFINSIKATAVKGDDTEKYIEVYPQGRAKHGNDRKGDKSNVRYATIGFIAEYGTSSKQARPYMTAANEKAHEKVTEAQRQIWESVKRDNEQHKRDFGKRRAASTAGRIYWQMQAESLLYFPAPAGCICCKCRRQRERGQGSI